MENAIVGGYHGVGDFDKDGSPAPRDPDPVTLAVDPAAGLAADPALGETVGHLP